MRDLPWKLKPGAQGPIAGRGPPAGWNAAVLSTGTYTIELRTGTVPMPATLALLGLGLAGLVAARRRQQ